MQTREAQATDVKDFHNFKKLHVPLEQALELVEKKELVYRASSFDDPGPDFTELVTTAGEAVGFWAGF